MKLLLTRYGNGQLITATRLDRVGKMMKASAKKKGAGKYYKVVEVDEEWEQLQEENKELRKKEEAWKEKKFAKGKPFADYLEDEK